MMNYEIFKEVVKEKFMDYMPDNFKGMELVVMPVEKVSCGWHTGDCRQCEKDKRNFH